MKDKLEAQVLKKIMPLLQNDSVEWQITRHDQEFVRIEPVEVMGLSLTITSVEDVTDVKTGADFITVINGKLRAAVQAKVKELISREEQQKAQRILKGLDDIVRYYEG